MEGRKNDGIIEINRSIDKTIDVLGVSSKIVKSGYKSINGPISEIKGKK